MNEKAVAIEPHLKAVARPSLYTSNASNNPSDKKVSILASLEADEPVKRLSRGSVFYMSIMALAAGLLYWANVNSLFDRPFVVPAWIETALNISKAPIPVTHPIAQAVVAKAEQPVAPSTEERHPATIVTETVPPLNTENALPNLPSSEKLAKLESEPAKNKSAEEHQTINVVAEKATGIQTSRSNDVGSHKGSMVAKVEPKQKIKPAETAHPIKPSATVVAKKGREDDEDVDLIAALLSRVSRPDPQAKEVKHKSVSTAKPVSSANSTSNKRQNPTDSNRDIVTRNPGDSTDGLLKRCKALGFIEGELCRVRICSKLWGKDPACPAEQVAMPNPN